MKKIMFIISLIICISCSFLTTAYAVLPTEKPTESRYTINENGVYEKNGYNSLTITFTITEIIGLVAFVIGLYKLIFAIKDGNNIALMGAIVLMCLSLLAIFAPWLLKTIGWLK